MLSLYLTAALIVTIMAIIGAVFHLGKSSKEADNVKQQLGQAEIAKDVRSGGKLDDKWLRYRD